MRRSDHAAADNFIHFGKQLRSFWIKSLRELKGFSGFVHVYILCVSLCVFLYFFFFNKCIHDGSKVFSGAFYRMRLVLGV